MLISRGRWEMKELGERLRIGYKRGRVRLTILLITMRTHWFIRISRLLILYRRFMIRGGSSIYWLMMGSRWRLSLIQEQFKFMPIRWIERIELYGESLILRWVRMRSRRRLGRMLKAREKRQLIS